MSKKVFIDGKRVKEVRFGPDMVPLVGIKRGMARVMTGKGRKQQEEKVPRALCVYAGRNLQDWHDERRISRRRRESSISA